MLALRLKERGHVTFSPKQNIVYDKEDTLKLLATKKKCFIFSDEMINVAYNRDFYDKDQKDILKVLNMYRDSGNVFFGAIPKFNDLDTQMRKICKLRIVVVRRGVAELHRPKHNVFSNDRWDTSANAKIEDKLGRKKAPSRYSTFVGILKFSDITPNQREIYEKIKEDKRGKIFNLEEYKSPLETFFDDLFTMVYDKQITNLQLNKICKLIIKECF